MAEIILESAGIPAKVAVSMAIASYQESDDDRRRQLVDLLLTWKGTDMTPELAREILEGRRRIRFEGTSVVVTLGKRGLI
jgi:hypothetical protein